jgi:glycosyltransferase involved in cell wall biosynthesis
MGYSVKLQVAGSEEGVPGYKKRLDALVEELHLTQSVEFLGSVSEERHRRALNEAHVFVLASLDEGVSVAAMEAMAMQTPSVVTDVGGMRELVDPGRDALMVPAKDPAALTQAILRILRDSGMALRLSEASRQKVAQRFHHRRSAEALAECLGQAPPKSNSSESGCDGVVAKRLAEA